MSGVVIVGTQWGDEGKGKLVDLFTEEADCVVRYAGGPNAGHTLVVGSERIVVRLVPSGILRPKVRCILGQGMVVDAATLLSEIDELTKRGYECLSRLVLSDAAHLILPYHTLVDGLREARPGGIGTTKRGVGPCYEDKMARRGVRLGLLRHPGRLREVASAALDAWAPTIVALGGKVPLLDEVLAQVQSVAGRLVPLLADTGREVHRALVQKERVLFEGAQGTLLDIDHGTYPFVTSSSAAAGGACIGSGIGPRAIDRVVGLVKAYCTRVGEGPFPTELTDENGKRLRDIGREYGSVTGRPRRCGWLDLPALRYAARINGLDAFALTKLDVLTGFEKIGVCVAYKTDSGVTDEWPSEGVENVKPVIEMFPGWSESLGHARAVADLPAAARRYVEFIEAQVGVSAIVVSVGERRDETIVRGPLFEVRTT
jgi:adenylosuccinate synthase